jgi:hypothetical protein
MITPCSSSLVSTHATAWLFLNSNSSTKMEMNFLHHCFAAWTRPYIAFLSSKQSFFNQDF